MLNVKALIDGDWITGPTAGVSVDPIRGGTIARAPLTSWPEIDKSIRAGVAQEVMRSIGPVAIADFLRRLADRLEERSENLIDISHRETGLAKNPRLKTLELPRTTDQLRQAAQAAQDRSWIRPTISSKNNVRSMLEPLRGPVITVGPSNFPLAFNSVVGGDAAAAWATGHPVIAAWSKNGEVNFS